MSCTLLSTTAPPSAERCTRAAPGNRKLPIEQVAIPCPIRHGPVLPRALVAVAPTVAAGALRVRLPQPVARPRPAVRGRHLGEVGQPQVEGVDPDLVGQLVHRALQRPQPRPLDRGPHRRRHVERDPLDLQPQPDRGRGVERLARLGGGLDVRLDQARVVDRVVLDAEQHPVGVGGEPDRLLHPRLVADAGELVGPAQVQLHRPPRHPRRRGGEDLVRPDVALGAEAAAGVRGDDAHVGRVDPERLADDRDDG